jgi:hypothetical protein
MLSGSTRPEDIFSQHVTRYDDLAGEFQKRAAVTSNFWFAKVPESNRVHEYNKIQQYFEHKDIKQVTDDIIVGYGLKY